MPRAVSLATILLTLVLAACGADGPPEKPAETGITFSGEGRFGVTSG